MGLSKPVITTEADISGITATLAEIKGAVQENSGGTDAPVIGMQTAFDNKNSQGSYVKLLSGTGRGKVKFSDWGSNDAFKVAIKIVVDGITVLEKPAGSATPDGVTCLTNTNLETYEAEFAFSESFEIYTRNQSTYGHYRNAVAYFQ